MATEHGLVVATHLSLPINATNLFESLEDLRNGKIDAPELGRPVRTSPLSQVSLAQAIEQCTDRIASDHSPTTIQICCEVIRKCTEILQIADEPTRPQGFPFAELPPEIRRMIYADIIRVELKTLRIALFRETEASCGCQLFIASAETPLVKIHLPWAFGPALAQEFLGCLFSQKRVRFRCTCEMLAVLQVNTLLKKRIRRARIVWQGPSSPEAFRLLAECKGLKRIAIRLIAGVKTHLNGRAEHMQKYFQAPKEHVPLTDARGLDELLQVRGIHGVIVVHGDERKGVEELPERERKGLEKMLRSTIQRPKEET